MNNESGVSLLEVMVAMIILAIGILGMAPMVVLSTEGNNIARDYTVASSLAKESLEIYQNLSPMPAVPYNYTEPNLEGRFTRVVLLNDATVDTLIPAGMYQLDVIVSWKSTQGNNQSTKYSTLMKK